MLFCFSLVVLLFFSLYLIFVINMCLLCSSFSSLQSLSPVQIFATLLTAALQNSLFITNSQSLCKLMSIELMMSSNHLILSTHLLLLLSIFPSIRVFSNKLAFASEGQNIRDSASTSVLPMNIQDWFPLGWTGWISFQSKGLSRVFSNTTVQKHLFFVTQPCSQSNSHIHTWLLEKTKFWLNGPLLAKYHLCFLICYLGLS